MNDFKFERIESRRGWLFRAWVFLAVLHMMFFPNVFFEKREVWAATLVDGSNFMICADCTNMQPKVAGNPVVGLDWRFESWQSLACNGAYPVHPNPNPTYPPIYTSAPMNVVEACNIGTSTLSAIIIEIDDDANFGSPLQTGWRDVTCGTECSGTYSYDLIVPMQASTKYYWRMKARDNYNTISNWEYGDSFLTNYPSILFKGWMKLKGKLHLK